MTKKLFTSESVTEGHPDKVCDAISDAILDACMAKDPMSRVACETATCTGFVLVTGEITTNAYVDIQKVVRDTVKEIGYTKSEYGFDGNTCAVLVAIDELCIKVCDKSNEYETWRECIKETKTMMINLKDVTCIQIGNVMLGIKDIEKISIHDGGVWLTINGDLIQGDIETKIGNVKLIAVE